MEMQDVQAAANVINSVALAAQRVRDEFIRSLVRAEMPMHRAAEAFTKAYCLEALRIHGWSYSRAARAIGMHRNSLARHVRPREIARKRRDHRQAMARQRGTERRRTASREAIQ